MSNFADYRPDDSRQDPGTQVEVRPARVEDLDACARLIVTRTGGPAAERLERLRADLQHPDRYTVVACADGEVIGYGAVIHHELSPTDPPNTAPTGYYLIGLIVSPDWRRHGIGDLITIERMRWTAERAHHAGGHTPGQSQWVADGNDQVPDLQVIGVAELRRIRDLPVGPQYGEIGQPVDPDHPGLCRRTVREVRSRLLALTDHMGVRQQVPVPGEHNRRPRRVAAPAVDPQARDPRDQVFGHTRDHSGVGIQYVVAGNLVSHDPAS